MYEGEGETDRNREGKGREGKAAGGERRSEGKEARRESDLEDAPCARRAPLFQLQQH